MKKTLFTFALLLSAVMGASGATRIDTMVTMSDGVRINAALYLPEGAIEPSGKPALLLVHGFGGSRLDYDRYARRYADSGYVALAYSVRGQGRGNPAAPSEGRFDWFTGERELEDVAELLAFLQDRSEVDPERIGIEGASQGGLTAWGAIAIGLPLRCAVPIIGVPSYGRSMVRDGAHNYFFVTALIAAQTFSLVELGPWLGGVLVPALGNDNYPRVVELLTDRERELPLDRVHVPAFMQMAWQDDLFGLDEAFDRFERLGDSSRILVWPGGHALPSGELEELRMEETFRFYRTWLRGDPLERGVARDSALLLVDPGTGELRPFGREDSGSYRPSPASAQERLRLYFRGGGRLEATPPTSPLGIPVVYVQNISNDPLLFRSSPLTRPVTIVGAESDLFVGSNGTTWQASLLLVAYDSVSGRRRPITRGSYQHRGTTPTEGVLVENLLSSQLYTIPAGYQLEAWVKFGLPGVPITKPSEEFGRTPYPPQASAFDTLRIDPARPSFVELVLAAPERTNGVESGEEINDVRIAWEGSICIVEGEGRISCRVVDPLGRVVARGGGDQRARIDCAAVGSRWLLLEWRDARGWGRRKLLR